MHSRAFTAMAAIAQKERAGNGPALTENQQAHLNRFRERNHDKNVTAIPQLRDVCNASVEVNTVVPSQLAANLKKAGYEVEFVDKKHGCECFVRAPFAPLMMAGHPTALEFYECETRDPDAGEPDGDTMLIVARAYSRDKTDALLQAVYAEMREEDKA